MSVATCVAFFASTAGTLAWYAYATRVSVAFVGTSIRKSELIHIGIVDGDSNDDETWTFTNEELDRFDLTRESCGANSVVWTSSSTGFPTAALKMYLSRTQFAFNSLSPVSTKNREKDGELTLYQSPGYAQVDVTEPAETNQYVQIPFAFKSIGNSIDNEEEYITDQSIWLVDTDVQASGQDINKAVRLHVSNPDEEFLINPNVKEASTAQTKYTKVAGLLDLDGDGYYDIDSGGHELLYGTHSGQNPTYDEENPYHKPQNPEEYKPVNFNEVEGITDESPMSTFYAKHSDLCYVPDMTGVVIDEAKYYTVGDVKPDLNNEGYFVPDSGKPITTTGDDGIGYATLTIFIEGWDHAVINAAIGYQFTLILTFEVDKVQ